ncbi:MAG: hypothetical protein NC517_10115 [Firmicutes bacterium]|nr:hypothetical protein [Bacillota bacterium]
MGCIRRADGRYGKEGDMMWHKDDAGMDGRKIWKENLERNESHGKE